MDITPKNPDDPSGPIKKQAKPSAGVADYLAGESKDFIENLSPHLPHELVGGVIPHIPGTEEEAVWNAASQACGTEKIHFAYSIDENKIWYLACPSSTLSSNPDSWCPLLAALPGNSEYWDKETVYLYEQEGLASALRWDPETGRMQVYLGASRTILPRVQSMDANFVTINPDLADIVPWRNRNLKTEKLARATAKTLVFSGMIVTFMAILLLGYNYIAINMLERDLAQVHEQTNRAAEDLMFKAFNAMQSDSLKHMVRIQEILDGLGTLDGTLVIYEVKGRNVHWEALIPPAFAQTVNEKYSARVDDKNAEKDGRIRVQGRR
ncbi:MAG: hypothetical protein CBB87_09625 [Micavibrio sp. TMED27]|nr:hypothetical protein [Micavibrio sp.]OUT90396.1 MAG: hypothetical protein CBB87_09625 [Micavibrio sp. TMED27]